MESFPARYFDGVTARPVDVVVEITDTELTLVAADGGDVCATWLAPDVRLVERPIAGAELRLRREGTDAARIIFSDDAPLAALRAHCPDLYRFSPGLRKTWRPVLFWGGGALLSVVFLFLVVIPFLAARGADWIPDSVQADLGESVADQLAGTFSDKTGDAAFCSSPDGDRALKALTDRLMAATEHDGPVTVRVVDTPVLNAFALPGGQILLFEGLLDFAPDSEAVAGVLAHEIGHVLHRHPMEVFLKNVGAGALIGLLFGDVTGGTIIVVGAQLYLQASYGQDAETEADQEAIALLNRSDIRADTYADFYARLRARDGEAEGVLAMLSTHPGHEEREARVRAAATGTGAALGQAEWTALQNICN